MDNDRQRDEEEIGRSDEEIVGADDEFDDDELDEDVDEEDMEEKGRRAQTDTRRPTDARVAP
jgi:hypothetical protein